MEAHANSMAYLHALEKIMVEIYQFKVNTTLQLLKCLFLYLFL